MCTVGRFFLKHWYYSAAQSRSSVTPSVFWQKRVQNEYCYSNSLDNASGNVLKEEVWLCVLSANCASDVKSVVGSRAHTVNVVMSCSSRD